MATIYIDFPPSSILGVPCKETFALVMSLVPSSANFVHYISYTHFHILSLKTFSLHLNGTWRQLTTSNAALRSFKILIQSIRRLRYLINEVIYVVKDHCKKAFLCLLSCVVSLRWFNDIYLDLNFSMTRNILLLKKNRKCHCVSDNWNMIWMDVYYPRNHHVLDWNHYKSPLFTNMDSVQPQHGYDLTLSIIIFEIKSFIDFKTAISRWQLKSGNGWVISYHTLPNMWSLIKAAIKVTP